MLSVRACVIKSLLFILFCSNSYSEIFTTVRCWSVANIVSVQSKTVLVLGQQNLPNFGFHRIGIPTVVIIMYKGQKEHGSFSQLFGTFTSVCLCQHGLQQCLSVCLCAVWGWVFCIICYWYHVSFTVGCWEFWTLISKLSSCIMVSNSVWSLSQMVCRRILHKNTISQPCLHSRFSRTERRFVIANDIVCSFAFC